MLEVLSVGGPTANRFDAPRNVVMFRKQLGNLSTALSTDEIALFGQDNWRLTPTFTLNVGLRWEGTFNPTPEANNDVILSQLDGRTFPIGKGIDPTQIPNQMNQFGPRVGFAWNPGTGTTVVRGYSGIYYARSPMLLFSDPMSGFRVPPGNLTVTLPYQVPVTNPNDTLYEQFLLIGINLNATPLGSLPQLTPEQLTAIANALGITANPYFGVNVTGVDSEFKNPRATQVGGGIERELVTNFSLGADVIYVKTDHLQRNRDLNIGVPAPRPTDPAQRPIFPARPLSTLAQVQIREASAKSEYTAMTLSSRLRRNWALLNVNYVLSKSMSDDDNERDSGGVLFENTFDLGPEWGPARLDRRHQFNGYAVFFLPLRCGPVHRLPLHERAANRRDDRPRHQQQPRRRRSSLQRSRRPVPTQRLPRRVVQGSQFPRAVGTAIRRGKSRARHVRRVQRVRRGQHPPFGLFEHHGHQLLRRNRA